MLIEARLNSITLSKNKYFLAALSSFLLNITACQATPKDNITLSAKNCSSWQSIRLNPDENLLLSSLRYQGDTYRTQNHQTDKSTKPKIYIKSIDDNFLNKVKKNNSKTTSSNTVNASNAYKKLGVNFKEVTSKDEYFNLKAYEYIKNEVLKINISKLDDLILDPHAQNILMLDDSFFAELHVLLGNFNFTQSSDLNSKRKLAVSDLASSLMMIVYGENLWKNTVFPAPIKWIPMQVDRSGAPSWSIKFYGENTNLYSYNFREYIAKGWYWDHLNEKPANWHSPYFGFWKQDKSWAIAIIKNLQANPDKIIETAEKQADKKIFLKTIHSLKDKLKIALKNIEQVEKTCKPKTNVDF